MVWQGRITSGEEWKRWVREDLSHSLIANVSWRVLQLDQDTGVSPWAQGMDMCPALTALFWADVGRASLVPKSPPSKPHAHTAPLPLSLFPSLTLLVSLGSWPGDVEGNKLPANKREFSRTVLVGLDQICQYLLRTEVELN